MGYSLPDLPPAIRIFYHAPFFTAGQAFGVIDLDLLDPRIMEHAAAVRTGKDAEADLKTHDDLDRIIRQASYQALWLFFPKYRELDSLFDT